MLSQDEFLKICKLARLRIENDEREPFLCKLNELFAWISQLGKIDTSGINLDKTGKESCGVVVSRKNDIPEHRGIKEEVLSNASYKNLDMFSVPKVVE